ncbi:DUF4303 domain-containing protein [Pasteurella sp. PK-2025]|uniref:DUF4303 domain-containing protein n=1 Tax=unclassified Pasteurella TaxID=2621516 RepID=UPI003C765A52
MNTFEDARIIVQKIKKAIICSVKELFKQHPNENFYYISLITSGEAYSPILSAWSHEALSQQASSEEEKILIKWSYADSPYTMYKNDFFYEVEEIFNRRDKNNISVEEFNFRINAMTEAMKEADIDGIFGEGSKRLSLLINVEVMPPDKTNIERAIQLNPKNSEILPIWLEEAGEE